MESVYFYDSSFLISGMVVGWKSGENPDSSRKFGPLKGEIDL